MREVIRPALRGFGYEPKLADRIGRPGLITTNVLEALRHWPLVVADLSGGNPNVFYELGVRHSFRRPVIQLVRERQPIPFDLAALNTVTIGRNLPAVREQLAEQVRHFEDGGPVESPYSAAFPDLAGGAGGGQIIGRRLFTYKDIYPIEIGVGGQPLLNVGKLLSALDELLTKQYDRLAAIDLVFLCLDNPILELHEQDEIRPKFERLVAKYDIQYLVDGFQSVKADIFRNYVNLVNEIGQTLAGTFCEVVLHNVLNPLRSVLAIQNGEVSGRKVGDPSTRFVVEYVKHQGGYLLSARDGAGWVAYPKTLGSNGRRVKATTTPIWHPRYGLIGVVCVNIDVERISRLSAAKQRRFFRRYTKAVGKVPKFEY